MKVKVKDIALAAGVSPATVSLVLNNRPSRIAEETREHILRIAREMQFQQESGLDFSAFKRVKSIGLIVPDGTNLFFEGLAKKIAEYSFRQGYTVFQSYTGDEIERFRAAIEGFVSKNVDGFLVIVPRTMDKENAGVLRSVQKSKVPLVLLDRAAYGVFCDFVTADNKLGGRIAAAHLIAKGHVRIGCMAGEPNIYTARKRVEGYREALAANKIPIDESLICYGSYDKQSGYEMARYLVEKKVTAIAAGNDLMAWGAYTYANEQGLCIPRDLAVTGYDNTGLCELLNPPLTSVEQNVNMLAEKGVDVLIRQIEKKKAEEDPARNYYFSPFLVERQSV